MKRPQRICVSLRASVRDAASSPAARHRYLCSSANERDAVRRWQPCRGRRRRRPTLESLPITIAPARILVPAIYALYTRRCAPDRQTLLA